MKSDIFEGHIRRMDLNLLWVFYALLRERKVTAAARHLAMTQSAVSQALARLRLTFNDPLFVRTGHGLKPTARALELEPDVKQIIETAAVALGRTPDRAVASEMQMRIGIPDNVSQALASFIEQTRHEAPGLWFSVRCIWGREGLRALMNDEIDLAVFTIKNAPPDIEQQVLYFESFALVARRGNPLAAEPMDLARFVTAEHAMASFDGDRRGSVDVRLEQLGLARRVVSSFPLFRATLLAVACSDMIALVNRSLALAEAERLGLMVMDPPPELELMPYPVHVNWRRALSPCPVRRWVVEQMVKRLPAGFATG